MALPRRPPSPERYETARRLLTSRVRGADPADIDVCLTLWRFSDELSASFEAFYAAHDLSRARGHVLVQLLDAPEGLTPAQLADRGGATPANMTGLLRSLQREGLIHRERIAGDRRSQRIRLTAAGRRKVQALLPALARRLSGIARALTPRQRQEMRDACGRICAAAKAMREETSRKLGPPVRGRPSARR
jgi:DNA-binding MarR family transcriptional regulator